MSKKRSKTSGRTRPAHGLVEEESALAAGAKDDKDDLIAVPKGETKLRFYLKVGLVIFLLIIFVVPSAFMATAVPEGNRGDRPHVTWTPPGGKRREVSSLDFLMVKRQLGIFNEASLHGSRGMGNLALLGLGDIDSKDDLSTTRFLILEATAREAGIRITSEDLLEATLGLFGSRDMYQAFMGTWGTRLTMSEFEQTLRRVLLVRRFVGYLAAAAATAAPSEVIERWQAEHPEYAFEYVQLATAGLEEEARAELPSDEELEAWFQARSERQKEKYLVDPRWSAELAYAPLEDEEASERTYEALLARFPREGEVDAEERARQYYGNFKFFRFRRAEELDESVEVEDPLDRLFHSFDEVREKVTREAPLHAAMTDWQADLARRFADPELAISVDLAAEAQELGLSYARVDEPRSRVAWNEAEMPWGGTESRLPARMANLEAGGLVASLFVDEHVFAVARVLEKVPRSLPSFEEIRERVADEWVGERKVALGVERLERLRDRLGERPEPESEDQPAPRYEPVVSAEEFARAAAEEGFEVHWRDYADRGTFRMPEEGDEPIEALLRLNPAFFTLAEGAVIEARAGHANEHVFLVRFAGRRDPDVSKLKPADLEEIRREIEGAAAEEFFRKTFGSREYLEASYGLSLREFGEGA